MKYLIFLDIDGTLLSCGVHPRTVTAIRQAMDAGHLVFINTGRSMGNVPKEALKDVQLTGIVAGLGSYVEMQGEVLLSRPMSMEEIALVMQIARRCKIGLLLEGEQLLANYLPEYFHPNWLQPRPTVADEQDLRERFRDLRVSKISFTLPLPQEAEKELKKHFAIINHPTYAEVGTKGLSKATAMDFLKQRFAIADDHVIAMGDSLNDVEMLRAAGIAVVMGDGSEQVKPLADFISIAARDGGVGQALEELVLKKK